jgi:hypothetical protein
MVTAIMRIEVRRTGGFAGVARRFSVDTSGLPAARAARIERLARALAAASSSADAFSYDVTVDGQTFIGVDAEALVEEITR